MRTPILIAAAFALAGLACSKREEPAGGPGQAQKPPPLTPAEIQRAEDACGAYVKRLCDCAAAHADKPELAEQCELKKAKPATIKMLLRVDQSADTTPSELLRIQETLRKNVADCIQGTAELPKLGC
jgi:hypothetical protein